jgi:hypothetical protein
VAAILQIEIDMKNLLDCHVKGMHSFPISLENGLYRRVFYASENHHLWEVEPLALAIHPHHVDIKITVLDGILYNKIYSKDAEGEEFMSFKWNSHILNGNGGFERVGSEKLQLERIDTLKVGDYVTMPSCELHTVYVEKGKMSAWLVEETIPTCGYFPINYSNTNLEKWTPRGLYTEVGDEVKNEYLKPYGL